MLHGQVLDTSATCTAAWDGSAATVPYSTQVPSQHQKVRVDKGVEIEGRKRRARVVLVPKGKLPAHQRRMTV